MTIRWPAGLVDESFDPAAEYAGELLDLSDTAIREGWPGQPVFFVEVVYPKVWFRVGDLNVAFGRGIDCDEPFDGYWADCWDDVTSIPLDVWVTGPSMRELVKTMAGTLMERGLVKRGADGGLLPAAHQRENIDKEVTRL